MSDTQNFDLVVIGGGPGGYVAALRASQLGLRTALVEKDRALGGTCLNVGCIPSKALLASSEHFKFLLADAANHGILADNIRFDLDTMLQRKNRVVRTLGTGVAGLLKKNKVTVFHGKGTVSARHMVSIAGHDGGESRTSATHIILATGSVPTPLPDVPFNGETIVSSTEALSFPQVPNHLVVIGAGAIGLELGSVWARLGAKVTVLEFLSTIAPGTDATVSAALQKSLEKQGLEFHLDTRVTGVDWETGGPRIHAEKNGERLAIEAERVLVAVGRKPYHSGVCGNGLTLDTDERGRIVTDGNFHTSIPGVFAIGDSIVGPMLAHKAEEDAVACVEKIVGKAGHVNYDLVPGVIYTDPEAASVGLTEQAARERGIEIKTGTFPFAANGRALAGGHKEGFAKVIADAATDRVLGVHILGPSASELIAEAVSVMEFQGSAEDIARTVHAHPTLSEALKEAALGVDGRMIHM